MLKSRAQEMLKRIAQNIEQVGQEKVIPPSANSSLIEDKSEVELPSTASLKKNNNLLKEDKKNNTRKLLSGAYAEEAEEDEVLEDESIFLQFLLNDIAYGIEVKYVGEIIKYNRLTLIPEAPNFIEGLVKVRENVVAVLDLSKKFMGRPCQTNKSSKIIVLEIKNQIMGIVTQDVTEVSKVFDSQLEEPPEVVSGLEREYIYAIYRKDKTMTLLLDIANIITNDEKVYLSKMSNTVRENIQETK